MNMLKATEREPREGYATGTSHATLASFSTWKPRSQLGSKRRERLNCYTASDRTPITMVDCLLLIA